MKKKKINFDRVSISGMQRASLMQRDVPITLPRVAFLVATLTDELTLDEELSLIRSGSAARHVGVSRSSLVGKFRHPRMRELWLDGWDVEDNRLKRLDEIEGLKKGVG